MDVSWIEVHAMRNMATIEIKAFLPSRDFDLSRRFYVDLGFTVSSSSEDLAYRSSEACLRPVPPAAV
jgi:hypothetical protein